MARRSTLTLSFLFLLFSGALQAQTSISGERGYDNGSNITLSNYTDPMMGGYTNYQEAGQTFRSALTTSIGTIEFYMESVYNPGNTTIEIYSCSSATSWGTLLGSKTNVPINAAGWISADVSSLNIQVAAGDYYGFKLIPENGLDAGIGVNGNLYADGEGWANTGSFSMFVGMDYPFEVIANSVLPIGLVSLSVQKQANSIQLQWNTASEFNTKSFIIQHSANLSDWKNIGSLAAAGNSNTTRNYTYLHTAPVQGNNYYRLLQTDLDGKFTYSNVKTVKFSNTNASFTIAANFITNNVVQLQVNNRTILSLYNSSGKLIWKKQFEPGLQSIPLHSSAKGIYILQSADATERIVVQ